MADFIRHPTGFLALFKWGVVPGSSTQAPVNMLPGTPVPQIPRPLDYGSRPSPRSTAPPRSAQLNGVTQPLCPQLENQLQMCNISQPPPQITASSATRPESWEEDLVVFLRVGSTGAEGNSEKNKAQRIANELDMVCHPIDHLVRFSDHILRLSSTKIFPRGNGSTT